MKRYNCTLSDKRGAFGLCMEEHKEGLFVPFSKVDGLLTNHRKRELALVDLVHRMVTMMDMAGEEADKDSLNPLRAWVYDAGTLLAGQLPPPQSNRGITLMMSELHDIIVGLDVPGGAQNSAEVWGQVIAARDRVQVCLSSGCPDTEWTDSTATPTERDYRELQAQHDALQSKYKAAQNLVHDIVGFDRELEGDDGIGTMADRIDALLAEQLPDPAVTVTETIRTAPERIWLQVGDQSHYHSEPFPIDTSEVSWCADSVMACEVPYVRADLAGKLSDHHEQHPDDAAVDRFAAAMKTKLAAAREKGRGGWDDPATCSVEYLADLLVDHVGKGNAGTFEDVANFAMMLHQRGAEPAVLASAATVTTCATCSGHGMIGSVTGQTPESMDFREAGCPDCNGRGKVKVKTHTITEGGEFESKILRWAQALTEGEEFELVTRLQTIARGASADPASAALVLLNRIDSDVDWLDDPHQLPPRQGGELCDSATPSFSPA